MTLKEFKKRYTGKSVDFDGYYGTQCMDLMHQYVYDVLELKDATILAAPCAKVVYEDFRWGMYFDRIDNTPHAIPEEGDIIFWGGGEWGHVAIFLKGDVNDFISFDANYPIGTLPHEQYHNYFDVLGWLRIKDDSADDHSILQKTIDALEADLEVSKEVEVTLMTKINEMDIKKEEFDKKYAKEVKELADQREECQKEGAEFKANVEIQNTEYENTIEGLRIIKEEGGAEVDKNILWESVKDPLRVIILGIIPFALAYLIELPYEWAGFVTLLLKGLDKYLHNVGKDMENETLIKGLTRF